VIRLGASGPRLRFETWDGEDAGLEAVARRPREALAGARSRLARRFGWLSPPLRRTLAVGALVAGAAFGYSQLQDRRMQQELQRLRETLREAERERAAFALRVSEERERAEQQRKALAARVDELHEREQALERETRAAAAAQSGALRAELEATRARLATLESERAVGERIVRDYGAGVCLIQGAYVFRDEHERPLRYELDERGNTRRDVDGNPLLDPEGRGAVHEVEYVGTGFLVDRGGLVLTNRHLGEPWWNDDHARSLAERGYTPSQTVLRAFFPGERQPFRLHVLRHSEAADLSLMQCELEGKRLPTLPLDKSGRGAVTGQPVVLVGFPAGIEAMLAKIDSSVARDIVAGAGTSTGKISEALAARGLVRPSTTQGHIADITDTDVVFDAATTQGGSGGPLLNRSGQVIGVAYAVLSRFGGNSFAVPVRRALPLVTGGRRSQAAEREREASGS
jgi:S1-C subfamily serine protease